MEPATRGLDLGQYALRVVGAELHVTDAAGPRADILARRFERDCLEAGGVVRADGGGDDV